MRTTQYLLATEKETPKDAELVSHRLMLRAGMIRPLASGLYMWLPTGLRVLNKVAQIVREEMNRAGAVEMVMPHIVPASLWESSGRLDQYGKELLRLQDRHDRPFCFGPTHEESFTAMAQNVLNSYKQLPINLYQIQTKFRDEIRPRFGVMRAREFMMKDAYSFHETQGCLGKTYDAMVGAYRAIFDRLGLKYQMVEADTGSIGGEWSHEFQVIADAGEDELFYNEAGTYAANIEKASALQPTYDAPEGQSKIAELETPNAKTIAALNDQHGIAPEHSVKTMVVKSGEGKLFAIILRGDHTLNLFKVGKLSVMGGEAVLATEQEIRTAMGAAPGSLGPVNSPIPLVVDHDAAVLSDFACGANKDGWHYTGVNWARDVATFVREDVRNVVEGDPSPDGMGALKSARGIEVGHVFQIDQKYSQPMELSIRNESGDRFHPYMGCYGIGVGRIVAAAIEQHHDEQGIVWPTNMAPFTVAIVPISYDKSEAVQQASDALYQKCLDAGIEVIFDDRRERPGTRFADMELLGIPHRVVISDKTLMNGQCEYKSRRTGEVQLFSINEVLGQLQALLSQN